MLFHNPFKNFLVVELPLESCASFVHRNVEDPEFIPLIFLISDEWLPALTILLAILIIVSEGFGFEQIIHLTIFIITVK